VLTDALVTESLRRGKSGLPPEMPPADEIAQPVPGRGKSLGPRDPKARKPGKGAKGPVKNTQEEE
jgi:ribosome maturation factor RimP